MPFPKTIVIGLGNPLLGDDGVGWRVAEEVQKRLEQAEDAALRAVEVDLLASGGISLMERLIDYERVIVVDAIFSGKLALGSVHHFPLDALENPFAGHMGSAHETNLQTALEVGRTLGASVPSDVMVVAIESPYVYDFSEELTDTVAASVPIAAQCVMDLLNTGGNTL